MKENGFTLAKKKKKEKKKETEGTPHKLLRMRITPMTKRFLQILSTYFGYSYLLDFLLGSYQNTYICGEFNKFPDFFVLAFRIIVHTWELSMLLLYILWDDWRIFMISASNEQLQQQLEYTY